MNDKNVMTYTIEHSTNRKNIALNTALTMIKHPQRLLELNEGYNNPVLNITLDNLFSMVSNTKNLRTQRPGKKTLTVNLTAYDEPPKSGQRVIFTQEIDYGSKTKNLLAYKMGSQMLNSIVAMHPIILKSMPKPPGLTSQVMILVSAVSTQHDFDDFAL